MGNANEVSMRKYIALTFTMKVVFDGDEHDEENSAECDRVTAGKVRLGDQGRSLEGGDI